MIETRAYARAGFVGNPSDGYYGKTISFIVRNFRTRVLLYPSARLEFKLSKADTPIFENLEELRRITRWRGYYGGIRILQALLMRFSDYCLEKGIELADRNFTIEYESSIPQRLGLGGSSAIITAALRALMQYFHVEIPLPIQANLVLETETRELGVPAGLQDRVIQVYEGLVYMDFSRDVMERQGYGNYEPLDPALLPKVYVAYRTSLSEGTEVFHGNVRERWRAGDPEVVDAMKQWADYACQARQALLGRDYRKLGGLINANFDLRAKVYQISDGNLEMIRVSRRLGATSNFAGSGGAIVGTYADEAMYQRLAEEFAQIGVAVIKPVVAAPVQ
ncbi:MAG: GHMP kinase [Acidobacteria bacterium]|nr:GHMP kinase [Acidobacteriota bacterium]